MSQRRVTGRFYFFMAVLIVMVFFIVRQTVGQGPRSVAVQSGTVSQTKRVQAVIVRDETVASVSANDTVFFLAEEGARVENGEDIAEVYSSSYSIKELNNLEKARQNTRVYQATLNQNIVDAELNRLNRNVEYKALELKMLIGGSAVGSFAQVEKQLLEAMQARQTYLSQNRREDSKLNALYDAESKQESLLASRRQIKKAEQSGVVSFYLDGRELFLTPGGLSDVTAAQLREIAAGWRPDDGETRTRPIFRVVDTSQWYLSLITRTGELNVVDGQQLRFQIESFPDVIYTAMVSNIVPDGGDTIITLQISDPIGPLLNQRAGWAVIGLDMEGFMVPSGAIVYQHEQTGVMLDDGLNSSFVPVQVLNQQGGQTLVRPISEGSLQVGTLVLCY